MQPFDSFSGVRRLVSTGVALGILCSIGDIAVDTVARIELAGPPPRSGMYPVYQYQLLHDRIAVLSTGVFMLTSIAFLFWLTRMLRNLPSLGGRPQSTLRASLAFVTPFVHLVRPYFVLRELWIESQPEPAVLPSGEILPRRTPLLDGCWTLYVVSWLFALFPPSRPPLFVDEYLMQSWLRDLSELVWIGASMLFIALLAAIEQRQLAQHDDLVRRAPAAPPVDRLR